MKSQTVNISLPKLLLAQVDLSAGEVYATRSDFIREALVEKISRRRDWESIFAYGRRQAKKLGIKTKTGINRMVAEFRHGKKSSRVEFNGFIDLN